MKYKFQYKANLINRFIQRQSCSDGDPSYMTELLLAFNSHLEENIEDESNNLHNELREMSSKCKEAATSSSKPLNKHSSSSSQHGVGILSRMTCRESGKKRKHGTVKPISASDEKKINSAVAMAETVSRLLLVMESCPETDVEGTKPNCNSSQSLHKKKGQFRFPLRSNTKSEKRSFSDETACIPDVQASLSDEEKAVYSVLVEKTSNSGTTSKEALHFISGTNENEKNSCLGNCLLVPQRNFLPLHPNTTDKKHQTMKSSCGGLFASRQFLKSPSVTCKKCSTLPAKKRGNAKTSLISELAGLKTKSLNDISSGTTVQLTSKSRSFVLCNGFVDKSCSHHIEALSNLSIVSYDTEERYVMPPTLSPPNRVPASLKNSANDKELPATIISVDASTVISPSQPCNPLPLPPRDRSKVISPEKPRHQRKHPLIMPPSFNTTMKISGATKLPHTVPMVSPPVVGNTTKVFRDDT